MARESFSYRDGTENWYVARALQQHGVQARYLITEPQPTDISYAAMAGVQMGGALVKGVQTGDPTGRGGHFITILSFQNGKYIVGDPLIGKLVLPPNSFVPVTILRASFWL